MKTLAGDLEFRPNLPIERTLWDRARIYPGVKYALPLTNNAGELRLRHIYFGYERREPWHPKTNMLDFTVHTTNGATTTTFNNEAKWLSTTSGLAVPAEAVSCNYIVGYAYGRSGPIQIARVLRPDLYVHWCNGVCIPGQGNPDTIAIEIVWGPGWGKMPLDLLRVVGELVLECSLAYKIDLGVGRAKVRTHRHVALPQGVYPGDDYLWTDPGRLGWRKIDPSGVSSGFFTEWRDELQHVVWPKYQDFVASW